MWATTVDMGRMHFMQLSLMHGWLPWVVAAVAWGSLIFGVAWWRRAIWHWIVILGVAGAAAVVVSWLLHVPSQVGSTYPPSFVMWGALPLFALGVGVWQWVRVAWWRRAVALVAVPGLAAFGGLQINAHYGYLPTLGDLLGAPLPGQVSAANLGGGSRFARMEPRVRLAVAHNGEVAALHIPAPRSHFHARATFVWLPPAYFERSRPALPVLMLLAGVPGSEADWLRGGGALRIAEEWAHTHKGWAPIMVFPDANGSSTGDTECVDGPRGLADTYLSVDVRDFIHTQFGAPLDAEHWAIGGLSEGGTCALGLATRHPDRFGSFADFSGDLAPTVGSPQKTVTALYGGSWSALEAHDPIDWFRIDAAQGVAGFVAVGAHDYGYLGVERQLALVAHSDQMNLTLDIIPGGGHNFRTWRHALSDAFPWIITRLTTEPSPPTAAPIIS
jgi:enterochelin esterase-like enzyme